MNIITIIQIRCRHRYLSRIKREDSTMPQALTEYRKVRSYYSKKAMKTLKPSRELVRKANCLPHYALLTTYLSFFVIAVASQILEIFWFCEDNSMLKTHQAVRHLCRSGLKRLGSLRSKEGILPFYTATEGVTHLEHFIREDCVSSREETQRKSG